MQIYFQITILKGQSTMETSQQQMQQRLLTTLYSLGEYPARASQSQGFAKDLVIALEAHFSLTLPELSKLNNLKLWFSKTSEGWSVTTKGKLSPLSSIGWENWAIEQNGVSLILRITESPKTGCVGIVLQDILEQNPAEQFFLSERITQRILAEKGGKICVA